MNLHRLAPGWSFLLITSFLLTQHSAFGLNKISQTYENPMRSWLPANQQKVFDRYVKDAQKIQKILQLKEKKKNTAPQWKSLSVDSLFADVSLFQLAEIEVEKKNYQDAILYLERLQKEYPGSSYEQSALHLLTELEVLQSLAMANKAKKNTEKKRALGKLYKALSNVPWKEWNEYSDAVKKLIELAIETKDPLTESYQTEVLAALPSSSSYRQELSQQLGLENTKRLESLSKFRGAPSPSGIKAINPDQELFASAMNNVLEEKWQNALELFQRGLADFPQSEHKKRFQYWIAVCLEKAGDEEKAKEGFQLLFQEHPFSYYGVRAAEKLKTSWGSLLKNTNTKPFSPLDGSLLPRQQVYLWRALALITVNLKSLAAKELEALYYYRPQGTFFGQNNPTLALQLASLYNLGGFHFGAFVHAYTAVTLDPNLLSKDALNLLFPRVYETELQKAAQETGINVETLLSVIKQESGFRPKVSSSAEALGLMQLLPSTGREILDEARRKDFLTPEANIKMGSSYLKKLLDRFENNLPVALAGYNAGPSRATQWLKTLQESPVMKKEFYPDVFIDSIPFEETRTYVGNILRNLYFYNLLKQGV